MNVSTKLSWLRRAAPSQYSLPNSNGNRVGPNGVRKGSPRRNASSKSASGKAESIARKARDGFTVSSTAAGPHSPRSR